LEIMPAPSAFQLAFAALGEPWPEAALLSAHARPLSAVVAGVLSTPKAAILTDNQHTPAVVAEALLAAGLPPDSPVAICENLGSPAQQLIRTSLPEVSQQTYAPLNVFVIWRKEEAEASRKHPKNYHLTLDTLTPDTHFQIAPGLPDEAFSTSAGQITKREVRLYSLAELALGAGEVLWDIGAGSGSVGIEAARAQPTATVYAVEKRAMLCRHLQENLTRFPAPNLRWVAGLAPSVLVDWPDPHTVFIGGSGGKLAEIIAVARQRLHSGGRLVINLATLENLQQVRLLLPEAQIVQAQFNRGVPILEMVRFEALNPVFVVTWRKV
jgi:precorrin-6Y C5,15-methyltransferase (decarboxylating)